MHAVQRSAFDPSHITIIVQATHALALSHWARAARAWTNQHTRFAGGELRAAARHAEDAASWLGGELTGVRAAAAEAAAVCDKLEAGAACTLEEVNHASVAIHNAIDAVGKQIGSQHKAQRFDHSHQRKDAS